MSNARWLIVVASPFVVNACSGWESADDVSTSPEAGIADGGTEADAQLVEADAADAADATDVEPDVPAACQGVDTSSAKPITGCAWNGYRGWPSFINGTSDTDIWVSSANGPIMHFDGQAWETFELNRTAYFDLLVFGPDSVLTGLGLTRLAHYDGSSWSALELGVPGFTGRMWGTSPCNMWTMGGHGFWLNNRGSGWERVDKPFGWEGELWGTGPNDMFTSGSELVYYLDILVPAGRIGHWNGTEWTEVWREEYRDIEGLWGSGSDDVFAVGGLDPGESLVLHFDGESWTEMPMPEHQAKLYTVFGFAPNDVYAAGLAGIIMHYDGIRWKVLSEAPADWDSITDIWGPSPQSVYFAAQEGVWRWDGTSMTRLFHWGPQRINHGAMAGSGPDNLFTVGTHGSITHHDGSSWTVMESGVSSLLTGVWTSGPENAYASGAKETLLHYDGTSWSAIPPQGVEGYGGVWGSADNDVYVAAENGLLLHYDGTEWTTIDTGTDWWLKKISGTGPNDVWVADNDGRLLHFDGTGWELRDPGFNIRGMAAVVPNELWVFTQQTVYHFDGTSWVNQYLPKQQNEEYTTIFGKSPNEVYVSGPTVMHFDGSTWSQLGGETGFWSEGMWAANPEDVWATGLGGVIFHYACR